MLGPEHLQAFEMQHSSSAVFGQVLVPHRQGSQLGLHSHQKAEVHIAVVAAVMASLEEAGLE